MDGARSAARTIQNNLLDSTKQEAIDVLLEGGEQYRVIRPIGNDVVTPLRDNGVKIQAVKQAQSGLMSTISVWLPFILLIGIWIFFNVILVRRKTNVL